ncbi:MDR family MFS transporter [Tomitella biformata]|uniref:MDR family MFS transporter n=1 Tax=Tomitella biformata TaxID=630403 RepID=UPI000463CAF4|nr:MFS transporter [Tomitella biformata]
MRGSRGTRASLSRTLADATPVVRLLVLTQLAFNIGFFMVLPYLAVHLSQDLGMTTLVVGAVLGLRTFSQQGLFIFGGILADRWGVRPAVLTGCVLRVLGFLGLAFASSLGLVLAATVLTGFAAALFSPAVESALAVEGGRGERDGGQTRVEVFALFSVCGQIGSFTGPLLGSALLLVDFRSACLVAAGVFVLVLIGHLRWLPRTPGAHASESWLAGVREVLANRRFVAFSLLVSSQLIAYNQLYLLLPLEVERAWGSQAPIGFLFMLSSVLVIGAQLRITRRLRPLASHRVIPIGIAIIGMGFLAVAAAGPFALHGAVGLAPGIVFVILLTVGQMIAMPFIRDLVPVLAEGRRQGAHFGFLASVGGVGVLLGTIVLGFVMDLVPATPGWSPVPWLVAAAIPLTAAVGLRRLLTGVPRQTSGWTG